MKWIGGNKYIDEEGNLYYMDHSLYFWGDHAIVDFETNPYRRIE